MRRDLPRAARTSPPPRIVRPCRTPLPCFRRESAAASANPHPPVPSQPQARSRHAPARTPDAIPSLSAPPCPAGLSLPCAAFHVKGLPAVPPPEFVASPCPGFRLGACSSRNARQSAADFVYPAGGLIPLLFAIEAANFRIFAIGGRSPPLPSASPRTTASPSTPRSPSRPMMRRAESHTASIAR